MYNHISYKPLQDCDYKAKKKQKKITLQNSFFMLE
jgi:hypothetical protein